MSFRSKLHKSLKDPVHRNSQGILHYILPLTFIAMFALIGTVYFVLTHAATPTNEILSGVVNNGKGDWCVNDEGSKTTANNPIYSAKCNGSAAQRWTYVASSGYIENTALSGTRCLSILNSSKTAGGRMVMNTCNGSAAQKWTYSGSLLKSRLATNLCLAVYGGYTGDQLRDNTCNSGYYSQQWILATYPSNKAPTTPAPAPAPAPTPTPTPTTGSSTEHIITTLYAYPTLSSWTQVENASSAVKYAIVNICAPDGTGSGCGKPADEKNPDWVPTIAALEKAGITPLYYISTNYDAEPLSTVESELANAKNWYGIANPMFDTTSTNDPSYYSALYSYSVGLGASAVMYNPGTVVPESYMFGGTATTSKEIMQIYEGTATGFEGASFPAWMKSYPAHDFAATLSTGTTGTIGADVNDAVKDNIGNFYEDDENEPPNYSTLPSFWLTEVNDIANAK